MTILNIKALFLVLLVFFGMDIHAKNCTKKIVVLRHGERATHSILSCQGLNRALALPKVLEKKYGKPYAIFASNPTITNKEDCPPFACCPRARPYYTSIPTSVYFNVYTNLKYSSGNLGGPIAPAEPTIEACEHLPDAGMMALPQVPSKKTEGDVCTGELSHGDLDLAQELVTNNAYCGKTVFVFWSHEDIALITYNIFHLLGLKTKNQIPNWPYAMCEANSSPCSIGSCSPKFNFDTVYVVQIDQNKEGNKAALTLEQEGLNNLSAQCPN